nr:MAG TPA: hypothetical protein [Caudoviricetes sp.]DAW52881.1 MAG TPA: hypothetical protein [Bacteriophage sp.]
MTPITLSSPILSLNQQSPDVTIQRLSSRSIKIENRI